VVAIPELEEHSTADEVVQEQAAAYMQVPEVLKIAVGEVDAEEGQAPAAVDDRDAEYLVLVADENHDFHVVAYWIAERLVDQVDELGAGLVAEKDEDLYEDLEEEAWLAAVELASAFENWEDAFEAVVEVETDSEIEEGVGEACPAAEDAYALDAAVGGQG